MDIRNQLAALSYRRKFGGGNERVAEPTEVMLDVAWGSGLASQNPP